jgi:hypothetical protein
MMKLEIYSFVTNSLATHLPWYGSPALADGARGALRDSEKELCVLCGCFMFLYKFLPLLHGRANDSVAVRKYR